MKPLRIFIFLSAVALLLFILSLLFPGQGISINRNFHLQFMKLSDLGSGQAGTDQDRKVKELLASSSVTEDPEAGNLPEHPWARWEEDTGKEPGTKDSSNSLTAQVPAVDPANADSLKKAVFPITFPEGGTDLLDPFFGKLEGLLKGTVERTRIMHFGDSQIEMDRMTALIRYRLQRQFGGSGPGLVQAVPLYSGHIAYDQEENGQWLRYTFFGSRDSTITHNSYGIMGAFTSVPAPQKKEGSWPSLNYVFHTSRRTGRFDRIRLFLHSYTDGGSLAFMVNDTLTDTITGIPGGFSVSDYRHHTNIQKLTLFMDLPQGGRIYGISFESDTGLQVDNIAMRGGSGLIFTKMNRELQVRMMEYLAPGLLILQYGGNVVPYINARHYQRAFEKELAFLRELCPSVPVIVIGPSDMSMKEKGRFETYPGVEPVRNALREAALSSGCAFWDLYEAMGGHHSMPSFVHADPPLATTDYIHFTALGVNLMAEMFYHALMAEYSSYLSQNK